MHVDADGYVWTMYDDGSCWCNFARGVVVCGTYDAFGEVKMHHVSGDVAIVCVRPKERDLGNGWEGLLEEPEMVGKGF